MMNQVVSTLPLSPRRNTGIGYYSIPLIADVVASFVGASVLNAVNILGAKGTTAEDVDMHFTMLKRLGIASRFQWCDADEPWNTVLARLFHLGLVQGWAFRDDRTILICPCGKTEFLAAPTTLSEIHGMRKVYEIRAGKAFCLLCNGEATPHTASCLLVQPPDRVPPVTVIPAYAAIEWDRLAKDNSGREILVSRVRKTGIQVECDGERFNIDVDFAWKLLPERLYAKDMQCLGLIVGHKTLKHALSMILLSSLVGVPVPEFIISTPYLSFDFGDRPQVCAEELANRHGTIPLRWLLGMAIGCTRKELVLQSKLIYLIKHSIEIGSNIASNGLEPISASTFWSSFNTQHIQEILSCLRQGKPENLDSTEYRFATTLGLSIRT